MDRCHGGWKEGTSPSSSFDHRRRRGCTEAGAPTVEAWQLVLVRYLRRRSYGAVGQLHGQDGDEEGSGRNNLQRNTIHPQS